MPLARFQTKGRACVAVFRNGRMTDWGYCTTDAKTGRPTYDSQPDSALPPGWTWETLEERLRQEVVRV